MASANQSIKDAKAAIVAEISELCRSTVSDYLEHPHEGGNAVESASYRYFRNVDIRIEKELFGVGDPSCVQIFVERHSRKFFEQSAKVIFGKSRHICDFFKSQIFRAVLVQIITYGQELFGIFLLFGRSDACKSFGACCIVASNHYQYAQESLNY